MVRKRNSLGAAYAMRTVSRASPHFGSLWGWPSRALRGCVRLARHSRPRGSLAPAPCPRGKDTGHQRRRLMQRFCKTGAAYGWLRRPTQLEGEQYSTGSGRVGEWRHSTQPETRLRERAGRCGDCRVEQTGIDVVARPARARGPVLPNAPGPRAPAQAAALHPRTGWVQGASQGLDLGPAAPSPRVVPAGW